LAASLAASLALSRVFGDPMLPIDRLTELRARNFPHE